MKLNGLLKLLVMIGMLGVGNSAQADWFYTLMGYECDSANDQLIVYYKGAYNEEGSAMTTAKTKNEWEPDDFIQSMKDESHIGTLKTVKRVCHLRSGDLSAEFGAIPGNSDIEGMCGGVIVGWVEVKRGKAIVLKKLALEDPCQSGSSEVTTRIVFKGKAEPAFTKISAHKFYR
ncbi:hypothetical protein [Pseudomonas sp. TE3786]